MKGEPITVANVTVTPTAQGASVQVGWIGQQVSMADIIKLRDWLILNYPDERNLPK